MFCRLDPGAKSLVYASAGHLPGYILAADGKVKCALDATDVPLGLFAGQKYTHSEEIRLESGDLVALITDGVTEAERPDQAYFGIQRALEFIQAHRQETAREIVEGLHRAVREFSDGMPQADDITAVVCKCITSEGRTRKRKRALDFTI